MPGRDIYTLNCLFYSPLNDQFTTQNYLLKERPLSLADIFTAFIAYLIIALIIDSLSNLMDMSKSHLASLSCLHPSSPIEL